VEDSDDGGAEVPAESIFEHSEVLRLFLCHVSETEVAIRDVLRALPTFMVMGDIFSSCGSHYCKCRTHIYQALPTFMVMGDIFLVVCLNIVNVVHVSVI
jgi:hypothetical protein